MQSPVDATKGFSWRHHAGHTVLRAVLFLALVLLPAAAAQDVPAGQLTLTLEGLPDTPIPPQVDVGEFEAVVRLACSEGERLYSAVNGQLVIDVAFSTPPEIVVTGPSFIAIDTSPCLDGAGVEARKSYQVNVMRTAPGLQPLPLTVTATPQVREAPWGTPAPQTAAFEVVADYYSRNDVDLASKLQECRDGQATYDLQVTNLGNARTVYTFELASQPSGGDWLAVLPDPLVLDSPNGGSGPTSGTATVTVHCPSGNKAGAFQLTILPSAADDPSKTGDTRTANLLARARPLDGDVPAPAGPWAAMSVLGAALLARRRA